MLYLIGIGLLLAVMIILLKIISNPPKRRKTTTTTTTTTTNELPILPADTEDIYNYKARPFFFSKAENAFFQTIKTNTILKDYPVFPKACLIDILNPENSQSARNKIDRKHIDFLVCKPNYFNPLICIELDDKTHQRPDRQERDYFINTALKNAGIPILRIPVQQTYNTKKLNEYIQQAINKQQNLYK